MKRVMKMGQTFIKQNVRKGITHIGVARVDVKRVMNREVEQKGKMSQIFIKQK